MSAEYNTPGTFARVLFYRDIKLANNFRGLPWAFQRTLLRFFCILTTDIKSIMIEIWAGRFTAD